MNGSTLLDDIRLRFTYTAKEKWYQTQRPWLPRTGRWGSSWLAWPPWQTLWGTASSSGGGCLYCGLPTRSLWTPAPPQCLQGSCWRGSGTWNMEERRRPGQEEGNEAGRGRATTKLTYQAFLLSCLICSSYPDEVDCIKSRLQGRNLGTEVRARWRKIHREAVSSYRTAHHIRGPAFQETRAPLLMGCL